MPYNDTTEYPSGIFTTEVLDTTPLTVVAAGQVKVSHVLIKGGSGIEFVVFSNGADTVEYFRLRVEATEIRDLMRGFEVSDGLTVKTSTVAGDVKVSVFYWQP